MGDAFADTMTRTDAARNLVEAVHSDKPVDSLTHAFYLYPARLSPDVVRAAIELFTSPCDLVMDPFVGGGTSLVEAAALGRPAIGSDINELAVFVSRAKTKLYSRSELSAVLEWSEDLPKNTNLRREVAQAARAADNDPFLNANSRDAWRVRKFVQLATDSTSELQSSASRLMARCILLRAGRWALDCRRSIPAVGELRDKAVAYSSEMTSRAAEYAALVRSAARETGQTARSLAPKCVLASAAEAHRVKEVRRAAIPRLVLCSPPYPGTHVLYHRWQVRGRRESPIPYWIAGCTDSQGPAYYTLGGRSQRGLETYYQQIRSAFRSIAGVLNEDSVVVQVIAFSDPNRHLKRYLRAMQDAGYAEAFLPSRAVGTNDRRLWRTVPNRKWYTYRPGIDQTKREVLLIHRLERRLP